MYSASKLNKQGDNIQPGCTAFPGNLTLDLPVLTGKKKETEKILNGQETDTEDVF